MTDAIPPDAVSLADYERLAASRLDANAAAYVFGGAGDELTVRRNREAFDRLALWPRPLADVAGGDARLELFGAVHEHPIFLAPVAYQRLAHPEGEAATARAAGALGACMVVSTLTSVSPEAIAHAAPGAPRWFQLYFRPDRGFTESLVRRAEALGFGALVVTVDAPFAGVRLRERRAGFRLPPDVSAVLLAGEPPAPPYPNDADASPVFDGAMRAAPTWEDLARLRALTRLPLLIKGVLHPEDAARALDLGLDGVIVSNHGGRVLDGTPAALEALPGIVARVAGRAPVLLDGGVTRGTDVLKALALGARAVLIGRPQMHGLAVAGALGVAHTVRLLRDEFEAAMALTGCRTLADIGPGVLAEIPRR